MSNSPSMLALGLLLLASFGRVFAITSHGITNNTYVRVIYDTVPQSVVYFDFGECYPYAIDGHIALNAVWFKSTTCFNYRTADCTGVQFPPLGVPVPGGTLLVNAVDFVHIIGASALCEANPGLPSLPLLPGVGL